VFTVRGGRGMSTVCGGRGVPPIGTKQNGPFAV